MSMLDRNAVINLWEKYHYSIATHALEFDEELMALPTIDPVRYGHWEFEGWDTYTCSSCGAVYGTEQLTALQQYTTDPAFPRYCPNCGAKMDSERKEE